MAGVERLKRASSPRCGYMFTMCLSTVAFLLLLACPVNSQEDREDDSKSVVLCSLWQATSTWGQYIKHTRMRVIGFGKDAWIILYQDSCEHLCAAVRIHSV